jgi:hypothetical protein
MNSATIARQMGVFLLEIAMSEKTLDFAAFEIIPAMPVWSKRYSGVPVPADLIGATIVQIGTIPHDGPLVEGGGLVIDFIRYSEKETRRIVLEFNECAMWVVYEGRPKECPMLASFQ